MIRYQTLVAGISSLHHHTAMVPCLDDDHCNTALTNECRKRKIKAGAIQSAGLPSNRPQRLSTWLIHTSENNDGVKKNRDRKTSIEVNTSQRHLHADQYDQTNTEDNINAYS